MDTLFYCQDLEILYERVPTFVSPSPSQKRQLNFVVNPFRTKALDTRYKVNAIQKYMDALQQIKKKKNVFSDTVFVNFTYDELKLAIEMDRVRYYAANYVNADNILLFRYGQIEYLNTPPTNPSISLNEHFLNYTILAVSNTEVGDFVGYTLSNGSSSDSEIETVVYARVKIPTENQRITILPCYPFQNEFFSQRQDIKRHIYNLRRRRVQSTDNFICIYYPFSQAEWLARLTSVVYEESIVNFFIKLPNINFRPHDKLPRNTACDLFRFYQRHFKETHILNSILFNYTQAFISGNRQRQLWFNSEISFSYQEFNVPLCCTYDCLESRNFFV